MKRKREFDDDNLDHLFKKFKLARIKTKTKAYPNLLFDKDLNFVVPYLASNFNDYPFKNEEMELCIYKNMKKLNLEVDFIFVCCGYLHRLLNKKRDGVIFDCKPKYDLVIINYSTYSETKSNHPSTRSLILSEDGAKGLLDDAHPRLYRARDSIFGSAVFKSNKNNGKLKIECLKDIIDIMHMEDPHCSSFDLRNISKIKLQHIKDSTILYCKFDTESG